MVLVQFNGEFPRRLLFRSRLKRSTSTLAVFPMRIPQVALSIRVVQCPAASLCVYLFPSPISAVAHSPFVVAMMTDYTLELAQPDLAGTRPVDGLEREDISVNTGLLPSDLPKTLLAGRHAPLVSFSMPQNLLYAPRSPPSTVYGHNAAAQCRLKGPRRLGVISLQSRGTSA